MPPPPPSCHIQHSPNTPNTGLRERGNDTSKSTGRSGRQKAATRRNMRRKKRVTVQGPVKEQQPDGMSHGGCPPPFQGIPGSGYNYLSRPRLSPALPASLHRPLPPLVRLSLPPRFPRGRASYVGGGHLCVRHLAVLPQEPPGLSRSRDLVAPQHMQREGPTNWEGVRSRGHMAAWGGGVQGNAAEGD